MSDPNYSSVTLLLHGDGSDGSTTFIDNSSLAQTITVVGTAQVDTDTSRWGSGSILISGIGNRLTAPAGAAFAFGAGDFCMELWVRPGGSSTTESFQCIASSSTWTFGANSGDWALYNRYDGVSTVMLVYKSGSSFLELGTGININTSAWRHIAITRSGTDLRVFVNGALGAATTYSGDFGRSDKTFMIGAQTGDSRWFDGHIDDVRVTKGVARYTAAFTPPTAAFPDTPPPPEIIISATGPLGVPALRAHHQFASVQATGPLGSAAIVAAQYYASIAAAGPLGPAAIRAHQQPAFIAASGPLGRAQVLAAQQIASISATGPLGRAQILATFPVVATVTANGPLGSASVLAWHDFTTSLTGQEISRYVMDLITPGGVVRVPISSWQATLQTDASCFVQAVVPASSAHVDNIVAATEFVITRQATLPSGQVINYEMARSPLEQIAPSQGPTNYTVVLSGYPPALTPNENPPSVQDRTLNGVRSVAGLAGSMRVRCSIDWLLRPGMRAYQDTAPLLVDYINYYVNTSDQYMDVGERT